MPGNATLIVGRGHVMKTLWKGDTEPSEGENDPRKQI